MYASSRRSSGEVYALLPRTVADALQRAWSWSLGVAPFVGFELETARLLSRLDLYADDMKYWPY